MREGRSRAEKLARAEAFESTGSPAAAAHPSAAQPAALAQKTFCPLPAFIPSHKPTTYPPPTPKLYPAPCHNSLTVCVCLTASRSSPVP